MNPDRDTLPDRILTTDDGRQTEYWYGADRSTVACVTREGAGWRLEIRDGGWSAALPGIPDSAVDKARRFAAAWTA